MPSFLRGFVSQRFVPNLSGARESYLSFKIFVNYLKHSILVARLRASAPFSDLSFSLFLVGVHFRHVALAELRWTFSSPFPRTGSHVTMLIVPPPEREGESNMILKEHLAAQFVARFTPNRLPLHGAFF